MEIIDVVNGGPFDESGVVEFRAHYRGAERGVVYERGAVHERSLFRRENGRWYYVRGQ